MAKGKSVTETVGESTTVSTTTGSSESRRMSSGEASNKPVAVFKARCVKVAVFANPAEKGMFYKTSVQRIYKDGEDWKTTTSLGRDDLPVAQLLLGKAFDFILQAEQNGN